MHLPAPSIHLSRPVPPILAALLVLIFAVVPASTRPPGPLLGSITLREKPQPLLKSGAVRSLPPPGARLEAVARLGSGFDAATLRNLGWRVQSEHMGFATLEGDPGTAPYLQDGAVSGLFGFRPARSIAGTMQASRRLSNVDGILRWGAEPNPVGVSGRGVLVGVIDFGFDTRHPAFLDSAGRIRF
ncbi:MAG TPA: hypothetical protein VK465_12495, partial [Fibrobacteria bacterium]|nr:hypothetical protein [Fibrobacteria bacterium]